MEKIVGESWREDWARVGGGGRRGGRPNDQTGSDLTAPQHSLLPSLAPIRSQPGHSIAALIAWGGGGVPSPKGSGAYVDVEKARDRVSSCAWPGAAVFAPCRRPSPGGRHNPPSSRRLPNWSPPRARYERTCKASLNTRRVFFSGRKGWAVCVPGWHDMGRVRWVRADRGGPPAPGLPGRRRSRRRTRRDTKSSRYCHAKTKAPCCMPRVSRT